MHEVAERECRVPTPSVPSVDGPLSGLTARPGHQLPTVAYPRERTLGMFEVHAVAVVGDDDLFKTAEIVVRACDGDRGSVLVEGVPDQLGEADGRLPDVALEDGLPRLNLYRCHERHRVTEGRQIRPAHGITHWAGWPPPAQLSNGDKPRRETCWPWPALKTTRRRSEVDERLRLATDLRELLRDRTVVGVPQLLVGSPRSRRGTRDPRCLAPSPTGAGLARRHGSSGCENSRRQQS